MKSLSRLFKAIMKVLTLRIDVLSTKTKITDPKLILEQYQTKAKEELSKQNSNVDQHLANMKITQSKLSATQKDLDDLVLAIKNASGREQTVEVVNDIKLMKTQCLNKLKLIDSYNNAISVQQGHINDLRNSILQAEIDIQDVVTKLQIACIENDTANLTTNTMSNINIDIQEVLDVVEGRKALVQAKKENDRVLNRNNVSTNYYIQDGTDEVYQSRLDELLK